jgi:hypothetical protein
VAREPVVLQPYSWVHLPIVYRDVGRGPETRGEPRITHVLTEGPWAPLVRRLAAISVVIAVMSSPAPPVVLSALVALVAVVAVVVVVDAGGSAASP